MNARELLHAVSEWLGWQDEDLSAGLVSAFDGLRLYEYWTTKNNLPEFADCDEDDEGNDMAVERIRALGYDPLHAGRVENYTDDIIGAAMVVDALKSARELLDSVAFVQEEGDSVEVIVKIDRVL